MACAYSTGASASLKRRASVSGDDNATKDIKHTCVPMPELACGAAPQPPRRCVT